MSGKLFLDGNIKSVNYKVEERGLFVYGFTSGVSNEIAKFDELIEREQNFAIIPDNSRGIRFVGRIKKLREIPGVSAAIYEFIVDEINASHDVLRKGINESTNASTSKQD